jgi:hypothetical protein
MAPKGQSDLEIVARLGIIRKELRIKTNDTLGVLYAKKTRDRQAAYYA